MTITEKWQGPAVCPARVVCLATKDKILKEKKITMNFYYRKASLYFGTEIDQVIEKS